MTLYRNNDKISKCQKIDTLFNFMASTVFEKLKDKKKHNIIESIGNVLSRQNIDNMSIIEIADEAEISRGTFYNYFNDKNDAIGEYCKFYMHKFIDLFKIVFKEEDNDLFKTIRKLFIKVRNVFKNETYMKIIKNIKYLNDLSTIITLENDIDNELNKFVDYIYENINKKDLDINNKTDMLTIVQLIGSIFSSSLIRYARGESEKNIDRIFEKKISIIEKGIKGK